MMNTFLEELTLMRERDTDSDTVARELFYKKTLKELQKPTNNITQENLDHDDTNPMHSITEYAMLLCNKFFKTPVSTMYLDDIQYKKDLLDFLHKEGELVVRNHSFGSINVHYCFFYEDVFITFYLDREQKINNVFVAYPTEVVVPLKSFDKFRSPPDGNKSKIGIIKVTKYGLKVEKLNLENKYTFSFDNYNKDFEEFFNKITNKLNEKQSGLYLFHGDPGTGKSSAIRHLLTSVKRNFIFIPPQMISQLSTPEFADIITDTNKGSVLILEDAEKALMKRETEDGFSNSALVASILNLTDGLYADLSNIAIIATYNCSRNLIDSALLRKGRMKMEYNFLKLAKDRAQKLSNSLGFDINIDEDTSLADIFNYEDQYTNTDKSSKKKHIGFGVSS